MVDVWGTDGEDLHIVMPFENKVAKLISSSKYNYKIQMGLFVCEYIQHLMYGTQPIRISHLPPLTGPNTIFGQNQANKFMKGMFVPMVNGCLLTSVVGCI